VFAKLTVRVEFFHLCERFVDDYTPSKTPSFGSESH
jgi:hypothetical protein